MSNEIPLSDEPILPNIQRVPAEEIFAWAANMLDRVERQIAALKGWPLRGIIFIAWDRNGYRAAVVSGAEDELRTALEKLVEDLEGSH